MDRPTAVPSDARVYTGRVPPSQFISRHVAQIPSALTHASNEWIAVGQSERNKSMLDHKAASAPESAWRRGRKCAAQSATAASHTKPDEGGRSRYRRNLQSFERLPGAARISLSNAGAPAQFVGGRPKVRFSQRIEQTKPLEAYRGSDARNEREWNEA